MPEKLSITEQRLKADDERQALKGAVRAFEGVKAPTPTPEEKKRAELEAKARAVPVSTFQGDMELQQLYRRLTLLDASIAGIRKLNADLEDEKARLEARIEKAHRAVALLVLDGMVNHGGSLAKARYESAEIASMRELVSVIETTQKLTCAPYGQPVTLMQERDATKAAYEKRIHELRMAHVYLQERNETKESNT